MNLFMRWPAQHILHPIEYSKSTAGNVAHGSPLNIFCALCVPSCFPSMCMLMPFMCAWMRNNPMCMQIEDILDWMVLDRTCLFLRIVCDCLREAGFCCNRMYVICRNRRPCFCWNKRHGYSFNRGRVFCLTEDTSSVETLTMSFLVLKQKNSPMLKAETGLQIQRMKCFC